MAKAQNTPAEEPEQDEPEEFDREPVQNIEPVEAGAVEGTAPVVESVEVDGKPFPIGYNETTEHYSIESRLTSTGNPVVTIRRNGYVGDEYDIPAAYFAEFQGLVG